jgi:hypothetical protein
MHIRRGVTFAACERLGTRCYRIGDKRSALFVQSSLIRNRLKHKCVGRFTSRFGCRYDPSFEVCGNFECCRYAACQNCSQQWVLLR